jgi:zinc/manganese transport system ATP-binding protein
MTGQAPAAAAVAPEILGVHHVSVSIDGRPILTDVSFAIRAGEFTGLIGPNGAGKTTLLRVILGLLRPPGGDVAICGQPRSPRNQAVGYVPQRVQLDPDIPMRARDLVALGIDGNQYGISLRRRHREARVAEMLHAVDADRFADVRVGALSGGEQQRVLIGHALIGRPRLLLLDEPLANLDLRSAQEITSLLARIAREQQIAVLLSAHEMNPLLPVLHRIVYLAAGRAASGTAAEVVRPEVLSALYGYPVDVLHVHGRVLVVAGPAAALGAAAVPGPAAGQQAAPGAEPAQTA